MVHEDACKCRHYKSLWVTGSIPTQATLCIAIWSSLAKLCFSKEGQKSSHCPGRYFVLDIKLYLIILFKKNSTIMTQHVWQDRLIWTVEQLLNKNTVNISVNAFDALLGFYKSTLQSLFSAGYFLMFGPHRNIRLLSAASVHTVLGLPFQMWYI